MNTYKSLFFMAFVLCVGCSKEPLPANLPVVNDENCKKENIARIQPESAQQEFSSKCFRRNRAVRSTSQKAWGPGDI